ncbi:MAG: TetR/AcrR family transcriptional regulator [Acetobacteraceae bacterium]
MDQTPKQRDIAEAATRLFMAQGYADVSMDAIAHAAGVSKATLYAYFASKERLFASLLGEACRSSGPSSVALADDDADVGATLTTLADRTLHFMLEEKSLKIYRVVIAEAARFPELGRVFYERGPAASRRNLGAWMERQMAAGHLRSADPGMAAEQFSGLLRTHLQLRALLGISPPPTEAEIRSAAQAAVETFLRAYAPLTVWPAGRKTEPPPRGTIALPIHWGRKRSRAS